MAKKTKDLEMQVKYNTRAVERFSEMCQHYADKQYPSRLLWAHRVPIVRKIVDKILGNKFTMYQENDQLKFVVEKRGVKQATIVLRFK